MRAAGQARPRRLTLLPTAPDLVWPHITITAASYLSIAHTDRLAAAGIRPSVGAVGSSFDNALAETIIGLYKTELIKARRPWRGVDDVEIATAEWVDWYNHRRPFRILRRPHSRRGRASPLR